MAHVRKNSEARLVQELRYASHLGLPAVMARLEGAHHANLARIISNHIHKQTTANNQQPTNNNNNQRPPTNGQVV